MPARSLIVLTDRSPNDFCSSSSRTALTMASRCRSPLVRRMPGGADSAVMARLSHRPTPETNLTCVKYGRKDRAFRRDPPQRLQKRRSVDGHDQHPELSARPGAASADADGQHHPGPGVGRKAPAERGLEAEAAGAAACR